MIVEAETEAGRCVWFEVHAGHYFFPNRANRHRRLQAISNVSSMAAVTAAMIILGTIGQLRFSNNNNK